jgi:serine protease Do
MSSRTINLLLLALVIVLGGVGLYRLVTSGKISFNTLPASPLTNNLQTRTVVQEENAITQAVERVSPSVVAIGVSQRVINPFDPFATSRQSNQTIGTGFIASDKGVIVTNKHVVSDTSARYSVVTKDGQKLDIVKIYRDPNLDLALVQVNSTQGLIPLELGDSSQLKIGQTAIAIGNALGKFSNTVTTGVVSGLGRTVTAGDPFGEQTELLDNLIQTDAAINPGNSGGPLLNTSGQVIGVNVATTEGAQNIGFAIPIDSVKTLLDKFNQSGGNIQTPFIGIRYRLVTRDIALLNSVPQGAFVQEILADSPASKAGIEPGDIITKIDNQAITEENKIAQVVQSKKVGDNITLEIWRDNNTKTVNLNLAASSGQ